MVYFLFIQILKEILWVKNGDPDQTPHNVATGLGQHCWHMSHKKGTRLTCILIKNQVYTQVVGPPKPRPPVKG